MVFNKIKHVRSQPNRIYEDINEFEFRFGKFKDPNEFLNGTKFEIRILSKDQEEIESLYDKIKEIIKE